MKRTHFPAAAASRPEIAPLTSLRFVAALYVFLFHIQIRWPLAEAGSLWWSVLSNGAVGMSIFFILSGFVLGHRYGPEVDDKRDFYVNRIARIYPIYLTAAIVTLPWLGISLHDDEGGLSWHAAAKLAFVVAANAGGAQAWFPSMFGYWNDSASWSISVEGFYYLLCPVLLGALARLKLRALVLAGLTTGLIGALPGVGMVLSHGAIASPLVLYILPIFRLPEFVLGICIFLLAARVARVGRGGVWAGALLALFLLYMGMAGPHQWSWVSHDIVVFPIVAGLIFLLAKSDGGLARALSGGPCVWLGKISYCFYSFQPLVLFFLVSHARDLPSWLTFGGSHWAICGLAFAALLAISAAAYHLIEEPCRRGIRRRLGSRPSPSSLG